MDHTRKVLIVGDGGVGKSALVRSLKGKPVVRQYTPTMGVEIHSLQQGAAICRLWDTAGQEKLSGLRDACYIDADAVIFVYDGTHSSTFRNLPFWIKDVQRVTGEIPHLVVRNKTDTQPQKPYSLTGEVPISARTGEGMSDVRSWLSVYLQ